MKKVGYLFLFISCVSFAQKPQLFLPELFNELPNIRDISISKNQNEFYFTIETYLKEYFTAEYENSKGKEDIYVSRFINGVYTKPVSLNSGVNSEKYEFNAFVAPDESFIIFTSYGRKDDLGSGDLYISKKGSNNKWLPAEHLTNLNSKKLDYCPFVDLVNNKIYYTTSKSNISNKLTKKRNFNEIIDFIKNSPNGLSRIYVTNFHKK